jgi:hypothetical protein
MREVLLKHRGEVRRSGDQEMVEAFAVQRADPALGDRVGPGARAGVRMMRMPAPPNTASKVAVNVLSRSRIKNRNCRVTQAPVGWDGR